ncbi:C2 calcium-dependent domain-containing protein 4C-like [Narcine bancroftii]|uniref:C2 calcium-dependent domain-containing protein 4C-like n=1 Tax=Narcine bancroftii TaxID=1343680 RepID=UPI00383170C8
MRFTANGGSFRSTIEGMLPWAGVRTSSGGQLGTAAKSAAPKKSKDIFSVMVTPDRIPKFFIPSLDVHSQSEQRPEAGGGCPAPALLLLSAEGGSESPTKSLRSLKPAARAGEGALLWGEMEKAADHSDPATRAALSLPHFQKITTPYGFPALGEIPHIRRKESLFFERDVAGIRSLLKSRRQGRALGRSRSSPLTDPKLQVPSGTCAVTRANRSASWEAITGPCLPPSPSPAPSSLSSSVKDESKFQILIKKHLASIKRMKSSSSSTWPGHRAMNGVRA